MYFRLKSAKPTYSHRRFEEDYNQAFYYEELHKNNLVNPCMFFETPEKFKTNLFFGLNKEIQEDMMKSTKRATTAYPNSKNNFENAKWIKDRDNFVPNSAFPSVQKVK